MGRTSGASGFQDQVSTVEVRPEQSLTLQPRRRGMWLGDGAN